MRDVEELDKLFDYGMKLLDSIEKDSLSEREKANDLENKLAKEQEEKAKFQKIVTEMEKILKGTKE